MKHRIRKLFSLTLALSMLLSMIPLGMSAESVDEFEGYETLEEIPFEFELEPGDLPFELLKDAVLAAEDIPYCISPALAEERGHVNRLYLQEPDDYTVMFQNRDGSKTVYVFSQPVKGMTMSTIALIQINGSVVSFTGSNAITSRIAELHDYNIGYSEIAYIPNGILSAGGINLTADARGWARGESTAAALSYNISSEAAAEYAASVTVPDTEIATAAVTPGVTITPIDPTPLGGMTVMSISYSNLAGVMSFKNTVTNQFLTLSTSGAALTTSASIVLPRSRWYVQYDTELGYFISNYSDVYNTYLGFDDTDEFIIDSLDNMMDTFTVSIESTANSIVTIDCDQIAISSTGALYEKNEDDDYFPSSCEWTIVSKYDVTLVTALSAESATRVEQKGVGFYLDYNVTPADANDYMIDLYYANTDQPVEHDTESYEEDEYEYFINTTGTYTVYYKDSVTGVKSPNFTLTVVNHIIIPESDVRIEQKNAGFTLDYTFYPGASTYSNVKLYYADTNTVVPHTGDIYTISTAGVYTVYYKDSVSGASSEEFTIVIYEIPDFTIPNSLAEPTFSIKPVDDPSKYLTMNVASNGVTSLELEAYNIQQHEFNGINDTYYNQYEHWDQLSRAFTIEPKSTDGLRYEIASILTKNQYVGDLPARSTIQPLSYTGSCYSMTDRDTKPNTLKANYENVDNSIQYSIVSAVSIGSECELTIVKIEDYYVIFTTFDSSNILNNPALKYVSTSTTEGEIQIASYNPTATEFRWTIDQIGVNAPLIKQTEKFTCGPATFLQVLYGAGIGSQVAEYSLDSGKGLHSQMMTLKNNILQYIVHSSVPGEESAGTSQSTFASRINNYSVFDNHALGYYYRWQKKHAETEGYSEVKDYIHNSLEKGWAPFFMTNTGGAPYRYDQGNGQHFICIIGYEEYINNEGDLDAYVIVSNCHYTTALNSIFAIPYNEFYENCVELFCYSETPIE